MKKSFLAPSVSALLVAVLAVVAFTRGSLQFWLLIGAFVIWGACVIAGRLAVNGRWKRMNKSRRVKVIRAGTQLQSDFVVPEIEGAADSQLLKHVNHRISGYLKSAWPEITWEWCCDAPEKIVSEGGSGRIRLFGVPDFNYAAVLIDKNARIDFDMMKVVPLAELNGQAVEQPGKPGAQPMDVSVWFDLQGRDMLDKLIADLNSRGHSSLSIKENGDVCIWQADNEVTQGRLKNLPAKVYWPRIAKLLEKDELAATLTDSAIEVAW